MERFLPSVPLSSPSAHSFFLKLSNFHSILIVCLLYKISPAYFFLHFFILVSYCYIFSFFSSSLVSQRADLVQEVFHPFICLLEKGGVTRRAPHPCARVRASYQSSPYRSNFSLRALPKPVRVSAHIHAPRSTLPRAPACARHTFHRAGLRHTFPILSERGYETRAT